MAKKVLTLIKLQIPGGQANPAPPVGPAGNGLVSRQASLIFQSIARNGNVFVS